MAFFAANATFMEVFSGDEACDFERLFSGFLAQLAEGACHWLFTAFQCSRGNLDSRGGRIWMLEHKEPIVVIDDEN